MAGNQKKGRKKSSGQSSSKGRKKNNNGNQSSEMGESFYHEIGGMGGGTKGRVGEDEY